MCDYPIFVLSGDMGSDQCADLRSALENGMVTVRVRRFHVS